MERKAHIKFKCPPQAQSIWEKQQPNIYISALSTDKKIGNSCPGYHQMERSKTSISAVVLLNINQQKHLDPYSMYYWLIGFYVN
jgi:hypothetical protein